MDDVVTARPQLSPGHPDFGKPGNQLGVTHGAWTQSAADLAEQMYEDFMAGKATPVWLKTDASLEPLLRDLFRWQAVTDKMWDWVAARDLEQALTDVTTESEIVRPSRTIRRSRRVVAVLEQLRRYSELVDRKREALGLPPRARARMRLDVAPKYDSARMVQAIHDEDAKDDAG